MVSSISYFLHSSGPNHGSEALSRIRQFRTFRTLGSRAMVFAGMGRVRGFPGGALKMEEEPTAIVERLL